MSIKQKFLLVLLSFSSCTSSLDKKSKIVEMDTVEIFNVVLNQSEIKNLIENYKSDTLFIIKNKANPKERKLNFPKNKIVVFMDVPNGYPKKGVFNYSKLQLSFENFKLHKDSANCTILIKNIGLLGEFKLKKEKRGWAIVNYSNFMI